MGPAGIDQLLRFFFRPQGRIGRREYILGIAFIMALDAAVLSVLWSGGGATSGFLLVALIVGLPLLVGQLVLVAKRCHDIGLPGSFVLLLFVPFVGFGWLVFLALMPGNRNANGYGPAPRFDSD